MLAALKKMSQTKTSNGAAVPQILSHNLQKKFSRGVQYNMKIVIRGDMGTGKTSLFYRLQGMPIGDYKPTKEIQVANVNWNYKNVEEVVKVEVWDIVDKGKKRCVRTDLKLSNNMAISLDAEFIDVYKGTDGAIIVMDITKNWTFSYVQTVFRKIPRDVPVLVLGNHCDMNRFRAIPEDAIRYYIDSVQRPKGQAQIRYAESSMVNGFGLRYIYKFLALPFFQLQRKTLARQMERNAEEIDIALQEIDLLEHHPLTDYGSILNELNRRQKETPEHCDVTGNGQSSSPSVLSGIRYINRCNITPIRETVKFQIDNVMGIGCVQDRPSSLQKQFIVEEFAPDGGHLDEQFFNEPSPDTQNGFLSNSPTESWDSESEGNFNSLVTEFQEDLDPDDKFTIPKDVEYQVHSENNMKTTIEEWPPFCAEEKTMEFTTYWPIDMHVKSVNSRDVWKTVDNREQKATSKKLKHKCIVNGQQKLPKSRGTGPDQKKIERTNDTKLFHGTRKMLKNFKVKRDVKSSENKRLKDSNLVLMGDSKTENKNEDETLKEGTRRRSKKMMKSGAEPLSESLKNLVDFAF